MASTSQHRCVFVGNIPYDATEEQLVQICEEVGPVVSFRLVLDRETGKPKGYGFCEYKDEETALSARRNLQGYEINGRQLRVDFAENDKGTDRNREQGRGGPGLMSNIDAQKPSVAPSILGNSAIHQPLGLQLAETAASVMAGFLGGGQNRQTSGMPGFPSQSGFGNDPLSQYLAKMSRNHLHELMSEMKALVTQNKALAQQLLQNNPQFTKALFQAQIMLGMVTPQMLQIPHIRQSGSSLVQPQVFNGAQRPVSQPHNSQEPENMSQIGSLFRPQGDQMPILMQNPLIPPPSALPPRHMPMQPRSQLPNVPQPQFPIQGATAGRSGVPVDPSIQISSFSSKPSSVPSAASTGLISMQPPVSQQPRYVVESLGNNSQQVFPSASTHQQPVLPHESSLLGSSNYLRTSGGAETSPANSGKPASVGYSSAWDPKTSLGVQTDVPNGALEPTNHPSKFARLEDGSRALPRSNTSAAASAPSQPLPAAPTVSADGMQPKQKQISQILPGVETDLLQQVMNLTPEQLSLLPADQREQVIQLQQMLRS